MGGPISQHDEQVRDYFDARVSAYDAFYEQRSAFGRWFNRHFRKAVYLRRDEVTTLAKQYGARSLLDVGCGGGRNTIWWATQGVERLVGVDIAAEMIESARQAAEQVKVGDRCTFETVDFMKTELSATYDIVAACGVFDYVENAVPFLARMGQFANKVIYGSFPGWTLLRTPIRKIRYSLRGCPTHFYRRRELQEIFDAVGFGRTVIKPVPSGFLAWSVRD